MAQMVLEDSLVHLGQLVRMVFPVVLEDLVKRENQDQVVLMVMMDLRDLKVILEHQEARDHQENVAFLVQLVVLVRKEKR